MSETAVATTDKNEISYVANGEEIRLSPSIVRNFIAKGGTAVTPQEAYEFMQLCRYQKLNPFLKEAYLVKYGGEATIVVGKNVFEKRAMESPNFEGKKAGIVIFDKDTKDVSRREGAIVYPNEELIGGWAEVYRNDYKIPILVEVSLSEYVQTTKGGEPNKFWKTKPATMIRKVAQTQALREAFPYELGGLYIEDEMQMVKENVVAEVKPGSNAMTFGGDAE